MSETKMTWFVNKWQCAIRSAWFIQIYHGNFTMGAWL